MNNNNTLESKVKLSARIDAIPGDPLMKELLYDDIQLFYQHGYSLDPQSPYQVFGETQKDLIIQFHKTGDMSYLQQYIQNRTDYYAYFNTGLPDNSELYEISSSVVIQKTIDNVSGEVSTIVYSTPENVTTTLPNKSFTSLVSEKLLEFNNWRKGGETIDLSKGEYNLSIGKNDLTIIGGGLSFILALAFLYTILKGYKNKRDKKVSLILRDRNLSTQEGMGEVITFREIIGEIQQKGNCIQGEVEREVIENDIGEGNNSYIEDNLIERINKGIDIESRVFLIIKAKSSVGSYKDGDKIEKVGTYKGSFKIKSSQEEFFVFEDVNGEILKLRHNEWHIKGINDASLEREGEIVLKMIGIMKNTNEGNFVCCTLFDGKKYNGIYKGITAELEIILFDKLNNKRFLVSIALIKELGKINRDLAIKEGEYTCCETNEGEEILGTYLGMTIDEIVIRDHLKGKNRKIPFPSISVLFNVHQ